MVIYYYPNVIGDSLRPEYRGIIWEEEPGYYDAWTKGKTGFPIVDAAMR